jgi:hypothetical protein
MSEDSSKSGGLSTTAIFFLLAFLGVGAPLMLSTTRAAPSSTISSEKNARVSENNGEVLLEEFFDADPAQFIDSKDSKRPWQKNEPISPVPNGAWSSGDPRLNDRISFLIATLPNPENPSLRYEFDRFIDAIQLAMSHENYFLDRKFLPFAPQPEPAGGTKETPPELSRRPGVMLFRRFDDKDDTHPERDSLAVVFIVGETPTGGVDATALRSALDQLAWLQGWTNGETPAPPHLVVLTRDNPNTITIIGPSYSGSAVSIQEVLRSWLKFGVFTKSPHISLLSGSATGIRNWPPELGDFSSTVLPNDRIYHGIVQFFHENLHNPSIAILADDTNYGNAFADLYHADKDQPSAITLIIQFFREELYNPPIAILADDTNYSNSIADLYHADKDETSAVTFLPYPIHIASVRTASESSRAQQANPAATPLGFAHRDPSIPDEDPGQDSYLVQSFSHKSAADDEVVLANLLSTIQRERFHYVGIVATNIQDAIFLIREIRDNCPDTIPFLTSADLLYLHSDLNRDLVGTLIFSTYPLFASNQLWTWPSNSDYRRLQFPSGEAEGVYNAVLAAVGDWQRMVEYASPFLNLWVSEEGFPTTTEEPPPWVSLIGTTVNEEPPLWVSVVGNRALWPVSIYPSQGDANSPSQGNTTVFQRERRLDFFVKNPGEEAVKSTWLLLKSSRIPPNFGISLYPRQFYIAFWLIVLLCVLPALYLVHWHWTVGASASRLPPRWLAHLRGEPVADSLTVNSASRRLVLRSFFLVLFTFFLVLSAVWLLPLRAMSLWTRSDSSPWFHRMFDTLHENYQLLAWAIVPTLIAGVALILWRIATPTLDTVKAKGTRDQASWTAWFRFIFSMIGAVFAVLFTLSIWWPALLAYACSIFFADCEWGVDEPFKALLYFVRAANLWNGVSPLLPMLYIGIAALWLNGSELWRLSMSDELTENFLGFGDKGSFSGIPAREQAIVHFLKCPIGEIPFWWLGVTLPLLTYVALGMPGLFGLVALEGRIFNLFFIGAAIYVYSLSLLIFGRFVAVWIELHSLLRRLAMHPTRGAYEELRTGSVAPSMATRHRISLLAPADSVIAVEFCLEQVRKMLRLVEAGRGPNDAPSPISPAETIAGRVRVANLDNQIAEIEPTLDAFLSYKAGGDWQAAIKKKIKLQCAMSKLSRQVTEIFEPWWRLNRETHLTARPAADEPSLDESLIRNGELFVASRVVDFLHQVFPQLMNLVVIGSVGLLAMMLAVSSYPFPQRDTLALLSWIILLSVIALILVIFIQINRDRVLSLLSGTTPGQLNWNSGFVWQLVVFGLIPILTLLGAQFPHALQGVFSSFGGLLSNRH